MRSGDSVSRYATVPLAAGAISLANCGLGPRRQYFAFDFWKQRPLGVVQGSAAFDALALGHCQVIAFHPVGSAPCCVGSSRHISMDAVSIRAQRREDPELVLEIAGVAGTTEDYWFSIPSGCALHGCTAEGARVYWCLIGGLAKVSVTFEAGQSVVRQRCANGPLPVRG
jgi:hypothetical protein